MKLATALSERAELQRKLSELGARLNNNAKVQDGEAPAEDPQALLVELDGALVRLEELMARINLTNSSTKASAEGVTITELLAKRDCLKKRVLLMRSFLDSASSKVDRYSKTEIRVVSTVDVPALQKQVDAASRALRETDEKLQELNWTTELL